ncbi:hypothetical protein D1159_05475 [Pseudoflavonifractor sp. 524-17]|uniref:RCC1 domain-containing protein n=1 Tax=Pseudoflavonifractor sp. 524-17 TaxID=2304577 RepID=UPI00137A8853|nr:S-layer homology domain-containing protein [Pseudoflavonifractor sp. 524-17]NCE64051.1 hypothetical protein [Pseudoflavonifractor sp. 524-17]
MRKRQVMALLLAAAMAGGALPAAAASGMDNTAHVASGGLSHTLVVKKDGTVWAWGSNQDYQLGLDGLDQAQAPTEVEGLSSVLAVAAGYNFSAALRFDGTVYQWGGGMDKTPRQVPGLTNVADIAAGQTDLLALKTDGTVWQWTYGGTPKQVSGLRRIGAIAAGGSHFLALTCSGEVWAWGANDYGQLGTGDKDARTTPVRVSNLIDIVDIAAGYSHSLAVSFDGRVYAWGANGNGQLGTGKTDDSAVPVEVKGLNKAARVSAGNSSSAALTESGELYTWGYGEYGQLGQRDPLISQPNPTKVSALQEKGSYLASGVSHNLMLNSNNYLFVWGRNRDYQVGNKKNTNVSQPTRVMGSIAEQVTYEVGVLDGLDQWAYEDIAGLYALELVPPMLWDNYKSNLTRGELAHILVSIYEDIRGSNVGTNKKESFEDLEGHPLERDIRKAYQLGILNGTSATTISPDWPITRQEAAKMLCSFLTRLNNEKISDKPGSLAFFADAVDIPDWAASAVFYVYENKIMMGDSKKNFNPKSNITRQEILSVIARLADRHQWGSKK